MDKTIELLKEAQARIKVLLEDYELAMTKFREGYELMAKHMTDAGGPKTGPDLSVLSEQERQLFQLLGLGLKGAAIAEKMGIKIKTFNSYRDKIRKKLSVDNSYELKRLAKELHSIDKR